MKKLFTFILGLGMVAGANAQMKSDVQARVYAYDLQQEETTAVVDNETVKAYTFTFKTNTAANEDAKVILFAEGQNDVVVTATPTDDTNKSWTATVTGATAGLMTADYNWKVSISNEEILESEYLATLNTWGAGSTYYRGGIAVENNPESDYFGTTYLGVGRSKGIFLLDPTCNVKDGAPYWVGKFNTGNASSTFRAALYNDKFYLTDWSDAYPGIWIFDPANPTAINNIFAGATNDGTGKLTINGVAVGGGSTGVAFTGNGDNRKMFIYVEDLPTGNNGNKLYRYDIGTEDTWGAKEPVLLAAASAKLTNTNTGLLGSALHNVVFCSQTRNANMNDTGVPAFLVINEEGSIVFNGGDLDKLNGCLGGGMALSADENKFAIVDGSATIQVYDVDWNENVPTFTHAVSISTKDQEISQMAFDFAGNLHCINRKHGYYVHSVPCEAGVVETPAKSSLVATFDKNDLATSVEKIGVDANAPVEYYNLQGVKVENPANGIFIRKQGSKTTKVVL